jgi:hypothetical protein
MLGTVRAGIPESMVIGLTIFQGDEIGASYLIAVFISNLPEAIALTAGLVASGWAQSRILWMWIAITVIAGLASLAGYALSRTRHRRIHDPSPRLSQQTRPAVQRRSVARRPRGFVHGGSDSVAGSADGDFMPG